MSAVATGPLAKADFDHGSYCKLLATGRVSVSDWRLKRKAHFDRFCAIGAVRLRHQLSRKRTIDKPASNVLGWMILAKHDLINGRFGFPTRHRWI
jgi:hypothetical protein